MKTTGKNLNFHFLILAILVLLFPILTFAHPGGLGADGCHVCKTNCEKWGLSTGERHCHNSSAPAPAPAPTPPPPPAQSPMDNEAGKPSSPSPVPAPTPPVNPPTPPTAPPPAGGSSGQAPSPNPIPAPKIPAPQPAPVTVNPPAPSPPPPPAPTSVGALQEETKDVQADKQTAAVSESSFFTKSSTMWLFSAVGVAILAALGFIASRRV